MLRTLPPRLFLACALLLAGSGCSSKSEPPAPLNTPAPPAPQINILGDGRPTTNSDGSITITTTTHCAVLGLTTRGIDPTEGAPSDAAKASYSYSFCLSKGTDAAAGKVTLKADGTLDLAQGDLFIASKVNPVHTLVIPYFYPLVVAKKVSAGSTLTEWIFSLEQAAGTRGASAVVHLRSTQPCDEKDDSPCGVVVGHDDHVGGQRVLHRAVRDGKVVYGELDRSGFAKEPLEQASGRKDRFDDLERVAHQYGVKD